MLDKEVVSIDAIEKKVITQHCDNIKYTDLVLAVGSSPKDLGVPGEQMEELQD